MPRHKRSPSSVRPLLCRLLLLAACGLPLPACALNLVTEDFPPLSFTLDGGQTVIGASADLLREALRRTGIPGAIALHTWRQAYKMALDDKNTCVFSTSRTDAREALFKWIGPLSEGKWILYARADSTIAPARSLDELKSYVIGGYQSDARTLYLKDKGLVVDEAYTEQQSLKKLEAHRVDLWSATSNSGPWHAKQLGVAIKPIIVFREGQASYAACNPGVPDEIVARLNSALQQMRADGTFQRLVDSYHK